MTAYGVAMYRSLPETGSRYCGLAVMDQRRRTYSSEKTAMEKTSKARKNGANRPPRAGSDARITATTFAMISATRPAVTARSSGPAVLV